MKLCNHCRIEKPTDDFHKARKNKDGIRGSCKDCERKPIHIRKPFTGVLTSTIRLNALLVLGPICVNCGFTDTRALQIDHVNGGGCKERRKTGGTRAIYAKIARGNIEGYQVLCANCNWIKRSILNEGATVD